MKASPSKPKVFSFSRGGLANRLRSVGHQRRQGRPSLVLVVGWVGVAAEEFFGVVRVVDFGWLGAVGPGEAAGIGDDGLSVALGDEVVIGGAGEEQFVGAGGGVEGPARRVRV